ncbi:hypothetical protein TWF103_001053 [Orbilia oligospora]|nr:hypothetical protein TWF103_001053 [Orbilia oligospora]
MENISDLYETSCRRFHTQLAIISKVNSEQGWRERQKRLQFLRARTPDVADNVPLNRLLDNLAFLLVRRRGGDCVSLALVGSTQAKIDMVAQASPDSAAADMSVDLEVAGNPQREFSYSADDPSAIKQHAERIFKYVKESSTLPRDHQRYYEILKELLTIQVDYNSNKLYGRVQLLKRFTTKVKGFKIPDWASLAAGESKVKDNFFLPPAPGSPGKDLGEVTNRKRHEREKPRGRKKIGMLAGLKQPESTAVEDLEPVVEDSELVVEDSEPAASPESTVHESILQHTLPEVQKPTAPSDHELESSMNTMEPSSSGPIHTSKPRKRDWFKTTMRKVIPVSITNRLTLRRHSRDTRVHVGETFGGSSLPSPGDNKKAPDADQAGRQDKIEEPRSLAEGHDEIAGPSTQGGHRVQREKISQTSFSGSFLERAEESFEEYTEATAVGTPSMDFSILWLVSQHAIAIDSLVKNDLVRKFASTRDLNLEVLPQDETEATTLPCEPILKTLSRLLSTVEPIDDDDRSLKATSFFLANIKAHEEDLGAKLLLSLDKIEPTIKVSGHAELILLSHLAKLRKGGQYVYRYLGLSKPPCLGHTYAYVSSIPIGASPLE